MVQNKMIQIDVAFLTYDPKRCSDSPLVKQDNSCEVGHEELKKHRDMKRREKDTMGADAYHHYKWYNSMLTYELKTNGENLKLKVIHWHIESGNTEAFMMNGKLYKSVSIIIGESMEHWYCANVGSEGSHSYGSRYRKLSTPQEESANLAIFTIDDNEAHFVVKDSNLSKCTIDVCANNCIECKKFRSPFSASSKSSKCACFPSREDFKSITESDLEDVDSDDDIDIAEITQIPATIYKRRTMFDGKFMLKAINEE